MINVVKKLMPGIIILGLTALVVSLWFKLDNKLIIWTEINGIGFYKFDLKTYLTNLDNTQFTKVIDFRTIIPSRQWIVVSGSVVSSTFWNALFNNLQVLFDWLYFPINLVLYIFRLIAWFGQMVLAVFGWPLDPTGNEVQGWIQNTTEYSSILQTILEWIKGNLIIKYL